MNRKKYIPLKKSPLAGGLPNMNGKTVAAAVLVAAMAVLWGRVLLKGKEGPAVAVAQEVQPSQEPINSQTVGADGVLPVQLAVLKGRNDILGGDLFGTDNWKAFDLYEDKNAVSVHTSQTEDNLEKKHQQNLEKIAKTLKLEAVIQGADGKPYQVFVNDAILTVGSVLTVKEGPDHYELALKEIKESEALFTWNNTSITLKMTEMVEK